MFSIFNWFVLISSGGAGDNRVELYKEPTSGDSSFNSKAIRFTRANVKDPLNYSLMDTLIPEASSFSSFTLDAGRLARSQYPEGPATGHLDTGFSWFPCV